MQKTWVQFLGWNEPLEEGMATHSSTLAWRIPMDRGAWRAVVYEVAELDLTERLSTESKAQKKKKKERKKAKHNIHCMDIPQFIHPLNY